MAQKLPAKVQIKSPICTILLSKSDFSFALLLVTFEPLDIQQSYIPLLKALMCGINAVGAQGGDCMLTFVCHFIKQKCYIQRGEAECKQAATPLSSYSINTTLQGFQKRYITLLYLKGLKSYQPSKFKCLHFTPLY